MPNEKPVTAIAVPVPGTREHTAYTLVKDRVGSALCEAIIEADPLVQTNDGKVLASIACSASISSTMMVLVAAYQGGNGMSLEDAQKAAIDYIQGFAEALRVVEPKSPTIN